MADTQSHAPGVIRSTRDYIPTPESPAPTSPDNSEDARASSPVSTLSGDDDSSTVSTSRDNPREIRNRAEKMRRDRLNQSVAELAAMVPPVVAARRKIDKTTVLRLTAHYLRAHQYVFGDSIGHSVQKFNPQSILKVLSLFNGFLITVTYRGIVVVVSQNVQQYLGYTELDLLGQNLLNITHDEDRAILREQLMPKTQTLGPNGELVIPDEPDAARKVEDALANEKRQFVVRFKKLGQRSEPNQYVVCHVEGSLRKSDRACRGYNRCCQIVRRARARSENPCSSGNDIVFIGIVRPTSETFINESALEGYRMEYRTRHSIDGEIIQCEARIALVTGYMTHEVSGVNAMNFMHRDDVRWVIIALREMYDQQRLFGESCYRLMTRNGQFIYMRTRGRLDVDEDSRAVTSFVCTNTVVDENEGRHLIKLMRKKFTLMVNSNEAPSIEDIEEDLKIDEQYCENQPAPVENPRRLEQVILHLVTNLPSPPPTEDNNDVSSAASPAQSASPTHRLTIIPPNRERIISAIEKIYSIIKSFPKGRGEEANKVENHSDVEPEENHDQNEFTVVLCNESELSPQLNILPLQDVPSNQNNMSPQNILPMQDNLSSQNTLHQQHNLSPQNILPLQNNLSPQHILPQQNLLFSENHLHQQNIMSPQTILSQQNKLSPQNNLSQQDILSPQPILLNENIVYPQIVPALQTCFTPSPQIQPFPQMISSQIVPTSLDGQVASFENSNYISDFVETPEYELSQSFEINGSENDFNSKSPFRAATSPDLGYFDESPNPYYTSVTSGSFGNIKQNGEYIYNNQEFIDEIKYQLPESTMNTPFTGFEENASFFQPIPQPSTSNYSCGTKRPNDSEDLDMVFKKKNTDADRQNELMTPSQTFEQLLDEALLNNQLGAAIDSLTCIDPILSDLLMSNEVHDILGEIEDDVGNKQPKEYNFSEYE